MSDFTFGIEEEYFLVDRRHGGLKSEPPRAFMDDAQRRIGPRLTRELLRAQIEIATRPHQTGTGARAELMELRTALAEAGRPFEIGIVAAGTHPFARYNQHKTTPKRRYVEIIDELGLAGLGTARSGLHVHVGVPAPERRIELLVRLTPYLPLLLALSTSSPFAGGNESGLLCYRNCANYALPRTGLPELMRSGEAYDAFVRALSDAGIIRDASYVWWDLRPSLSHPTIELRITDCCTAVDDAVAIAALFRCLVRHLARDERIHAGLDPVGRALIEENVWRAQRYGTQGTFIDIETRKAHTFADWLGAVLDQVAPDAAALGAEAELAHTRRIARDGTSAHRQLAVHAAARRAGRAPRAALRDLARWLVRSTEAGVFEEETVPLGQAA
jgi:carboxylate-amine ligase